MAARHEPELWMVRHGETEWSRERRHTGRSDLPLTETGEAAARALKPRLDGVPFDLVLASPLQRARETAALAGLDAQPEPLAQEWDYGEYEGVTTAEIQRTRPGWSIWTSTVPGGETLEEVAARADQVIDRVRREAEHRAVLVAHAHFLRILAVRWLDQSPLLAERFNLLTATVSVLAFDRGLSVIDRWNT
jgi:broad specificity phosphatase PhoE